MILLSLEFRTDKSPTRITKNKNKNKFVLCELANRNSSFDRRLCSTSHSLASKSQPVKLFNDFLKHIGMEKFAAGLLDAFSENARNTEISLSKIPHFDKNLRSAKSVSA